MPDIRVQRLAKLVVHYSIGVKEGQLISISASTIAQDFVAEIYREILQAGARPLLDLSFPGSAYAFYKYARDDVIGTIHPIDLKIAEEVDARIRVSCQSNSRELTNVDHSRVAASAKAYQPIRDLLNKKEAEGKFKWVIVGYPHSSRAQDAEMSLAEYEDFVFGACGCHLDYPVRYWIEQSKKMEEAHNLLQNVKKVRIIGCKTDLTLDTAGRKWVICDGRCNMPDGEIFTSPIEDSAEGEIFFDIPTTYSGVEASGIHLGFHKGRVIHASAEKGEEFLLKMLETDDGAKLVGEIAFGLNEFIQKPTKNILFDEKIGGSIHLAVGASYPEAGGKNKSGLHWDLIKNMKNGGCVEADGQKIYENGKFL